MQYSCNAKLYGPYMLFWTGTSSFFKHNTALIYFLLENVNDHIWSNFLSRDLEILENLLEISNFKPLIMLSWYAIRPTLQSGYAFWLQGVGKNGTKNGLKVVPFFQPCPVFPVPFFPIPLYVIVYGFSLWLCSPVI